MQITIKSIHVTEMHEKTWGRVYIQYEQNGKQLFIFKNWLYFDEKTYKGIGNLDAAYEEFNTDEIGKHHSIYLGFPSEKRHVFSNYKDVLNGVADHLYLTTPNYKAQYGTPSIILKRLLIELRANLGEPLENRTGWYQRYQSPELVLSEITIDKKNKIYLPLYDTELILQPLLKLVYFLFLNHLEGIVIKDRTRYEKELQTIYGKLSTSSDVEKINNSINELVDLDANSFHEKISKINKILKNELGDKIAPYYQIMGSAGHPYKINLGADLIKKLK